MAGLRQERLTRLLIHGVVAGTVFLLLAREFGDDRVYLDVEVGTFLGGPRDDERRARLVNQDRVDFVHDGIVQSALHTVVGAERHIVAQIIETVLVVRAISNIRGVGLAFGFAILAGYDDAHGHS